MPAQELLQLLLTGVLLWHMLNPVHQPYHGPTAFWQNQEGQVHLLTALSTPEVIVLSINSALYILIVFWVMYFQPLGQTYFPIVLEELT